MKTSSAKAKGARLQKWVCEKISNVTGLSWGKDEPIASREMGQCGVDVRLVGEALRKFPFSVECKNQQKWQLVKWIEQAKENQLPQTDWILFVSRNHFNPVVVMDAEAFFRLYKEIAETKKPKWSRK